MRKWGLPSLANGQRVTESYGEAAGKKEGSQLSPTPFSRIRGRTPFSPLKLVYQIFKFCQGPLCSRRESNPDSQFSGLKPYPLGNGSITIDTAKAAKMFPREAARLAVNFFSMADGKHEDAMSGTFYRVDDSVVSRPQAVVVAVLQFFTSERSGACLKSFLEMPAHAFASRVRNAGIVFQKKNLGLDARSHFNGKISKFLFSCSVDEDAISHLAECSAKKSLKGLKGPDRRDWAMARSIKSSWSSLV